MNFESIFHLYQKVVYNLALQYVGNIEDAEEITQDVFVKVYYNLNRFRNESAVKTWVYRITINQSLDYLKAKKRNKRAFLQQILRLDDQKSNVDIPDVNHPGFEIEQKEALAFIFKCLQELPQNQQTAIILLKIERLSQKEAAQIMDLTEKALESVFQRAKNNLQKLLNRHEGK